MAKMKELFGAYNSNELPTDGGYIVSSFFDETSTYTKYEITSYNNVKDIYITEDGITFQADGRRVFILVEPANYSSKHIEPTYRDAFHKAPYRFKEVDTITSRREDRIMIGKDPVDTYGSFTILKTFGNNYSYIFYKTDDLVRAVEDFFAQSLWQDARVPKRDAEQAAKAIAGKFEEIVIW